MPEVKRHALRRRQGARGKAKRDPAFRSGSSGRFDRISRSLAVAAVLVLSACGSGSEFRVNPNNGIVTRSSPLHTIHRDATAQLGVRALHQTRDGQDIYSIHTRVQRFDAVLPRIVSGHAGGYRLPYIRIDEQHTNCTIHCLGEETGMILMTPEAIAHAAENGGLSLSLSGLRGNYLGHVPASAFRSVLEGAEATLLPVDNSVDE